MTKNTQVSIEDVGPLIAWLTEQAIQTADADQSRDAGMLTWAAQVIGECVDEDAPDPPAVGEVGDEARYLAKELRDQADDMSPALELFGLMHRAADLLEQRHPEPVPVSERLPGPEDCDAEGRCWLLTVEDEYPQWRLHSIEGNQPGGSTMIWVPVDSSPGVMVDAFYASHWLSYPSLPLPDQE